MFDKIGKQLDAVFIATPNHHHAPARHDRDATGQGRVLREAALPRHRRGPQAARAWPASPRPPPKWATRAIARTATAGSANSSGPASSATSRRPIAGPTAPMAASGRARPRCRRPPACIGTPGLAPPPTATTTRTCTRTSGMAGMTSATVRSATWAATCWTACSGRSRSITPPASRPKKCGAAAMNAIRPAAVFAGTFPRAATCRR